MVYIFSFLLSFWIVDRKIHVLYVHVLYIPYANGSTLTSSGRRRRRRRRRRRKREKGEGDEEQHSLAYIIYNLHTSTRTYCSQIPLTVQ